MGTKASPKLDMGCSAQQQPYFALQCELLLSVPQGCFLSLSPQGGEIYREGTIESQAAANYDDFHLCPSCDKGFMQAWHGTSCSAAICCWTVQAVVTCCGYMSAGHSCWGGGRQQQGRGQQQAARARRGRSWPMTLVSASKSQEQTQVPSHNTFVAVFLSYMQGVAFIRLLATLVQHQKASEETQSLAPCRPTPAITRPQEILP